MAGTVIVNNLDLIQRKLAESGPAVDAAMKEGLREAVEPTAKRAEQLSLRDIRRMRISPAWAATRIGITRQAVYVVPKERGTRDPRNPRSRGAQIHGGGLVPLMMTRSFDPALEFGARVVEERVNLLLGAVTRAF